ncbi:MAG: hypothetical protein ACI9C4_003128 [Paraglaciecola sp.]
MPGTDKSLATTVTDVKIGGASQLSQNSAQQLDVAGVQTVDRDTAGQ